MASAAHPQNVDADRRKSPRKKTFLLGKVVSLRGVYLFDCDIRNISASGACIALSARPFVPKNVFLIIMKNGAAHEAEVKWRDLPQLGLEFLRSYSLDGQLPDELGFLQQLWAGGPHAAAAGAQRDNCDVAAYKEYRICVVAEEGGYGAYAQHIDCQPADGALSMGRKVTTSVHKTSDEAMAAAKKWCDAALSGWITGE